jgi:uncharacterized damage-inducible protein DinB
MITAENLIAMYARNLVVIQDLTKGLTHTDSLVQPPAPGNCINWVLGHIAAYRNNRVLGFLGQPLVFDENIFSRYGRDSKPVTQDEPDVYKFEALMAGIETAQTRLAEGLRTLSPEQAQTMRTAGTFNMTIAEWMLFLLRHEAYHVGNLELLREVAVQAQAQR